MLQFNNNTVFYPAPRPRLGWAGQLLAGPGLSTQSQHCSHCQLFYKAGTEELEIPAAPAALPAWLAVRAAADRETTAATVSTAQ